MNQSFTFKAKINRFFNKISTDLPFFTVFYCIHCASFFENININKVNSNRCFFFAHNILYSTLDFVFIFTVYCYIARRQNKSSFITILFPSFNLFFFFFSMKIQNISLVNQWNFVKLCHRNHQQQSLTQYLGNQMRNKLYTYRPTQ